MIRVSLAEAKNRLAELVRRVEAGEQVLILKRHKPAARLLSEAEYEELQRKVAVAGLRALRGHFRAAGIQARELYEESRRQLEEHTS